MSTFWTPEGERPIRREPTAPSTPPGGDRPGAEGGPAGGAPGAGGTAGAGAPGAGPGGPGGPEEMDPETAQRMAELTEQMLRTPAELVVANHAYGLFELAALHLSQKPPHLDQARTAIDAMVALVEGMKGRLGDAEAQLQDGVGQLRMAFVEIAKTATGAGGAADGGPGAPPA
jgi:hypothetical protein